MGRRMKERKQRPKQGEMLTGQLEKDEKFRKK